MADVKARTIDGRGSARGERALPGEIFGGSVNPSVLHQVVTAQLAEARSGTASTKTRSEVRGGGSKPWRQKGTGRARHGSIRSPLWVGGGTVFGPKPRSYAVKVNKKMRAAALRSALADKAAAGAIWVLEGFDGTKTREARECLEAAGIEGRVLLVLDGSSEADAAVDRCFRNLDQTAFTLHGSLATYDVLVADALVFTADAFERIMAAAGEKKEASA
jgi:large subunit ribosomal protein L4